MAVNVRVAPKMKLVMKRLAAPSPLQSTFTPKLHKSALRSRVGLNHNRALNGIEDVTISVDGTIDFYKHDFLLNQMVHNLNRHGVCLVNVKHFDNSIFGHRLLLQQNMLNLKPLFGETALHQKSDPQTGILCIDPRTPNSVNVARTDIPHPPHTDGAFLTRPEKIVTIGCEHAAVEGGESTLICAQSMLECVLRDIDGYSLNKQRVIRALFNKSAIEIGRKLPQNTPKETGLEELHSKQAVLSYLHEYDDDNDEEEVDIANSFDDDHDGDADFIARHFHENDNLRLVYHGNPSYLKSIHPDVEEVWHLMGKYCAEDSGNSFVFKLQPGQILVIDNSSFLHGRTPYDSKNNLRVLHRLNFYHNGLLRKAVKLGINKEVIAE